MIRYYLLALCLVYCLNVQAQDNEAAIRKVLATQAAAWNAGSIEHYMQGYWNNDSLVFVGKNGPTYGYRQTLERYKASYSDTVKMGKLRFELLQLQPLSNNFYFVLGKWYLTRSVGDVGGSFTLIFKKVNGHWVIIADHSS